MKNIETDLLIIGGGINGTGIAADAAGRGLSVVLCEKDDLASATSSASTKLIHGGLRYLERFDFRLVHEALKEREILLKKAPHLIHPLPFVLPYVKQLKPAWLIRLGLYLYDHLAKRSQLPNSKKINLSSTPEDQPLKNEFTIGFEYYDCFCDDARLVITNSQAAKANNALIFTRTSCVSANRMNGKWQAELLNHQTHETIIINSKAIVNATGPWVSDTLEHIFHITNTQPIQHVKGSHIVIPKLYHGEHAYILQTKDKRVVFAIPYFQQFTLIGTTDVIFHNNLDDVSISKDESDYLCDVINTYFKTKISAHEIVWSYAGVRPLYGPKASNPSKISRDYHLEITDENHQMPLLSVYGGKITTFRKLAEHALQKLEKYFPSMGNAWTENTPLPGGDLNSVSFSEFLNSVKQRYNWLPETILFRYAHCYGSFIHTLLKDTHNLTALGQHFGAGLYEKEVLYLIQHEWAKTTDDIIWRRTKLGLFLSETEQKKLNDYLLA